MQAVTRDVQRVITCGGTAGHRRDRSGLPEMLWVLARLRDRTLPPELVACPGLRLRDEPQTNVARYDLLRRTERTIGILRAFAT